MSRVRLPDVLSGCQGCAYRMRSLEEASTILKNLVRVGHMRTIEGGGLMLEAHMDPNVVLKMCLWESHCEDCEHAEEMGDGPEGELVGGETKKGPP